MTVRILIGDARRRLKDLPDESVQCIVTSPPYFGLRDYGVAGQIGLESTPDAFVAEMVALFREARRVLRDDGTLWLNLGDSYAGSGRGIGDTKTDNRGQTASRDFHDAMVDAGAIGRHWVKPPLGLKQKDLIGIPWRVAFALQADGWWLRQDIIWSKPNPMPESVTDRCTKAHEYLFLLSKNAIYSYDADAIRTPYSAETKALSFETMDYKRRDKYRAPGNVNPSKGQAAYENSDDLQRTKAGLLNYAERARDEGVPAGANKRSVWTVPSQAFADAHFATFPPTLIEPCILAGCPKGGTVLDPFGGAGTTGLVADRLGRNAILIELNPEYAAMAERRIKGDAGMMADVRLDAGAVAA
jgi:DNA modification methylase